MFKKILGIGLALGFSAAVFGGDGTLPLFMSGTANNGATVEVSISRMTEMSRTNGNNPCGSGSYLRATGALSVNGNAHSIQGVCSGNPTQVIANGAQLSGSVKMENGGKVFVGTLKTGDGTLPLKLRAQ